MEKIRNQYLSVSDRCQQIRRLEPKLNFIGLSLSQSKSTQASPDNIMAEQRDQARKRATGILLSI
ncbi:hypothetical protein AMTR_s00089p00155260 [Amborella trichopoda]|uniref:Uncharacterized protein n=1 Tax=Amborella trichopoda TaxID=13333 RepID=W1P1V3_AMBTC|nr:hypothetical protein AMTR_s00089p00155260 [Amborella trichopoda]